jgi:hypothetical protein
MEVLSASPPHTHNPGVSPPRSSTQRGMGSVALGRIEET